MSSRFAGAADLAQRRRRRLAQEECAPTVEPESTASEVSIRLEPLSVVGDSIDRQLLRRFLSPRLWKHVAAIAVMACLCMICLHEVHVRSRPADFSAAASGLVITSRTVDGMSGLLLLAAGQLSLLIGLMRSRSEIDFRGRYRWWRWMAVALTTFACLQLTATTQLLASGFVQAIALLTGPIHAARHAVLLVPATAWCLLLLTRVIPDMSRYRSSQTLLITACLCAVGRILLPFAGTPVLDDPLLLHVTTLAASLLLCSALLLHARFVIYICNDPPEEHRQSVREAPTRSTSIEVMPTNAREPTPDKVATRTANSTSHDLGGATATVSAKRKQSSAKRKAREVTQPATVAAQPPDEPLNESPDAQSDLQKLAEPKATAKSAGRKSKSGRKRRKAA